MFFFTTMAFSQLSINEVSYYSFPKFVEISGPVGLDLTGWRLNFYEGKNMAFEAVKKSIELYKKEFNK